MLLVDSREPEDIRKLLVTEEVVTWEMWDNTVEKWAENEPGR